MIVQGGFLSETNDMNMSKNSFKHVEHHISPSFSQYFKLLIVIRTKKVIVQVGFFPENDKHIDPDKCMHIGWTNFKIRIKVVYYCSELLSTEAAEFGIQGPVLIQLHFLGLEL